MAGDTKCKAYVVDGVVAGVFVVDDLAFDPGDGRELVPVLGELPAIGWLYANGQFSAPPVPDPTPEQQAERLQFARRMALARIRAGRSAAELADVTTAAGTFAADLDSQRRIGLAAQQAQDAITAGTPAQGQLDWETADGTAITLTARQCLNLAKAFWKQAEAAATKARGLRAQVAAAPDIATLDAITW